MSRSLPLDAHEHAEIVALCFATRPLLYPIVEHRLRFNNINNVIQKGPSVPDVTSLNMCVCVTFPKAEAKTLTCARTAPGWNTQQLGGLFSSVYFASHPIRWHVIKGFATCIYTIGTRLASARIHNKAQHAQQAHSA